MICKMCQSGPYFVEQLRPFDTDEISSGFVGNSLRQQRLAASRWAPEQDTTCGFDADSTEKFRPLDRLNNGHVELLPRTMQRANIRPRNIRDSCKTFTFRGRLDLLEGKCEI